MKALTPPILLVLFPDPAQLLVACTTPYQHFRLRGSHQRPGNELSVTIVIHVATL